MSHDDMPEDRAKLLRQLKDDNPDWTEKELFEEWRRLVEINSFKDDVPKAATSVMKLTEQERQLVEIIRTNADSDSFRVSIERHNGAWEISLGGKLGRGRGAGSSFAEAWDDMGPDWA
jgi:hypothetical protein